VNLLSIGWKGHIIGTPGGENRVNLRKGRSFRAAGGSQQRSEGGRIVQRDGRYNRHNRKRQPASCGNRRPEALKKNERIHEILGIGGGVDGVFRLGTEGQSSCGF